MKSLASINGIGATWDIVFFLCISAILFFWGVSRGKNRIKFVILALYIGIVLFGTLPLKWIDTVLAVKLFIPVHTIALLIIVLLLLFFLQKIFRIGDSRGSSVLKTLLLSFITTGFIMSILVAQISISTITFSSIVLKVFSPMNMPWLWNTIPILGVIFL